MSHATRPFDTEGMPPVVPYIVANEAAERFSYYGMKAILVIYMTKYLTDMNGDLAPMSDGQAKTYYHLFATSVYFFPILGAIVADAFFGKYRTIIGVSLIYCLGHLALALGDGAVGAQLGLTPRTWLTIGLTLIAIGSGGIKPCVSAHVGDQFGSKNEHLLGRVFGWFYWAINLGAFASQLLIPSLLESHGPSVAFGVPGALMALATVVFWLGRNRFVHIPAGGRDFLQEVFSRAGLALAIKLGVIYAFSAMFWALFDQTGSAWVLQAERMDRSFLGIDWLSSQIQAINPILILVFIPLFNYGVYPLLNKFFPLTALRKIGIGMFLAVPAFLLSAYAESRLATGATVSIGWQLGSYVLITAAEVFLSITLLEFSYTQAPNRMKSFVMGLFLASVALGNLFTAIVNAAITLPGGTSRFSGVEYYLFFSAAMFAAAVGYVVVARLYQAQSHIQGTG
ncbi:MAG: hypothetical protein RJA70_4286 [Pseudomonadota bacterium]|jgi:POT family proton-dependent oligopeptide transporter